MTEWIKADEWDGSGFADLMALVYNGVSVEAARWPDQRSDPVGWLDTDDEPIHPPVTHIFMYPDPPPNAHYVDPESYDEKWLRLARAADQEMARRAADR